MARAGMFIRCQSDHVHRGEPASGGEMGAFKTFEARFEGRRRTIRLSPAGQAAHLSYIIPTSLGFVNIKMRLQLESY